MNWQPIKTGPKDGTQVLLATVDDDGIFGIRHGWFESGHTDRCWYDIDGEQVDPQFWAPIDPLPPGAAGVKLSG